MDLQTAQEQLYRGDPDAFVATRTELVTRARADGDRDLAARIGALGKPTRPAWLVNLLAHERGELVEQLLDLAELLGEAHRTVAGAELRTLTRQRHALIAEIARTAIGLGADRGYRAPEAARQQVTQTLDAALADAEVAAHVRAGILTRPATFSGFGPVAGGDATATARPTPSIAPVIELDSRRRGQQARQATAAAERAREDRRRAESALERAGRRMAELADRTAERDAEVEQTGQRLAEATTEVDRLEAELERARRTRQEVSDDHDHAVEQQTAAREHQERSQAEVDRAEQQIAEADRSIAEAEALLEQLQTSGSD